ncbi:D-alanyl-D-alanine-carboxypeptidase/endopeptidase AmpH [Methylocella silvestris]|uniref:D-alanyl-D-alanine-carboxypeptidase/endopeptidase AmpH n=1 Tax=Methylocella silvestris TaxID=199596 RepID=A0A2J7TJ97_METSI|nr:D-alanyl-D-alanine-carboxypeptidase/endopeptidase AmpH [Methylocella silvestris]PNG26807.1 D-alanyl-D-alanine-carboxypeptidase/endopeptidase AmpH [Methylocella silvestris]
MNRRAIFLSIAILAAPFASRADDGADPVLAAATDVGGVVMFMESGAPGMVLAVVRGGHSLVVGYGETEKGNKRQPDGETLVRLNSITKVFATETLAALSAEGKLRLTDTLQRYAGAAKVPALSGHEITLLDLATHSAALPREMGQSPEGVMQRAWPTRADRWAWLPGYKLPWTPGAIASYSNVSFDLLADAIETAAGEPYPTVLRTRVTAPLGMANTMFSPTPAQCERLMVGSGLGGAGPCVDTTATDGSGGLYSTANDMARWLRHNLEDANDGPLALSHAVYRQRQALDAAIGFDEAGPMSGLGLGWVITAGQGIRPTLIAKSGGGVGFMSYIVFAPGRGVGLFVAVNRADFGMFKPLTEMANGIVMDLVTR